jgi:hypothetical protein
MHKDLAESGDQHMAYYDERGLAVYSYGIRPVSSSSLLMELGKHNNDG